MMQIVKHKQDPINAMILSKEGKTTAMVTMTTTVRTRIIIFDDWRITPSTSLVWFADASGRVCSPQRISRVATRGRQLSFH